MDLIRAYRYIALQGFPENAARLTSALADFCSGLYIFPNRGTLREDLRLGLRVLGYKDQAIIAFAVDEIRATVTILRILRRGQSIERAFAAT